MIFAGGGDLRPSRNCCSYHGSRGVSWGSECPTAGPHGQDCPQKSQLPRSTRLCLQPWENSLEEL